MSASGIGAVEARLGPRVRALLVVVCLAGSILRGVNVWRPFDGRTSSSWREADVSAVARNFDLEGMNVLYPRIDWRGDGPGYAEMEFPFQSYGMALVYRLDGGRVHEVVGRLIAYVCGIFTLAAFCWMAVNLLPPVGALVATAFFALSPLPVLLSTQLQPEPLMLLCYVVAAAAFFRWLDTDAWRDYAVAIAATALAILAKSPAALLGLLFLVLLVVRRGLSGTLRDARVWGFAAMALAPGVFWYWHAHHLWLQYGNSLGVSNEAHFIGADFLTDPSFLVNIVHLDVHLVWTWAGVALAVVAWRWGRPRRPVAYATWWLAAVAVYYVVACRTTSGDWAWYYHVVSAPPVALLVGSAAAAVTLPRAGALPPLRTIAVALLVPLAFLMELGGVRERMHPDGFTDLFADAQEFAPRMAPGALVLVSGGRCTDAKGNPVAYNASYMFYWTGHRGFNSCLERQSVDSVAAIATRGAGYFIAEKKALAVPTGFGEAVRQRYRVIAEGRKSILFALTPSPASPLGR